MPDYKSIHSGQYGDEGITLAHEHEDTDLPTIRSSFNNYLAKAGGTVTGITAFTGAEVTYGANTKVTIPKTAVDPTDAVNFSTLNTTVNVFATQQQMTDMAQNDRLDALEAGGGGGGGGATVQPPFIEDYTDTNVFTLPKTPAVIFDILVLESNTNLYYLRDGDYSVSGANVTISAPTLSSGMTVKINYTAI